MPADLLKTPDESLVYKLTLCSVIASAVLTGLTTSLLNNHISDSNIHLSLLVSLMCAFVTAPIFFFAAKEIYKSRIIAYEAVKLASYDDLTGVYNRRHFMGVVKKLIAEGRTGVLAYLDVDHFKAVNDHYGHQVGDDILRMIATEITSYLSTYDIIARIGGEEFAIFFPNSNLDEAKDKCLLVSSMINKINHPIMKDHKISVSVGVAEQHRSEDIDALLKRADVCLYIAKDRGRNRIVTEDALQAA